MTPLQQIIAHLFSLLLMIVAILVMYWISYEFAHYTFWTIGCFAFGWIWSKTAINLINKHD